MVGVDPSTGLLLCPVHEFISYVELECDAITLEEAT